MGHRTFGELLWAVLESALTAAGGRSNKGVDLHLPACSLGLRMLEWNHTYRCVSESGVNCLESFLKMNTG